MRGLPDNSQLLHSYDILPAAHRTERLTTDYHVMVDELRELFTEYDGECWPEALPFVTPVLVIQWTARHETASTSSSTTPS